MANVSLATLKAYWQNVSDWVKGTDAVSAPKVKLAGGNAPVKGTASKIVMRYGALAAVSNEIIIHTTEPIIIDSLSVSSNYEDDFGVEVKAYDELGVLNGCTFPYAAGTGISSIASALVVVNGESMFEIGNYSSGDYRVYLKRPIELPKGGQITVRNATGQAHNISVSVLYRKL